MRRRLGLLADLVGPSHGSVVMGAGSVSVALGYDGDRVPSRLLLGVEALVWVALVAVVGIGRCAIGLA